MRWPEGVVPQAIMCGGLDSAAASLFLKGALGRMGGWAGAIIISGTLQVKKRQGAGGMALFSPLLSWFSPPAYNLASPTILG